MKIYIVKSGDSLWKIAQKHNVDLQDLIKANPQLSDHNNLILGTKIIIPTGGMSVEPKRPTMPMPVEPEKPMESPESPEMEMPKMPEMPRMPRMPERYPEMPCPAPERPYYYQRPYHYQMPYYSPCQQRPYDSYHMPMGYAPMMPYNTPYYGPGQGMPYRSQPYMMPYNDPYMRRPIYPYPVYEDDDNFEPTDSSMESSGDFGNYPDYRPGYDYDNRVPYPKKPRNLY